MKKDFIKGLRDGIPICLGYLSVSFVNMMLLAFGLVFEMPVIIFLLSKLGIIKPAFLKKNRGIIIVAIFIFAAIITPPDVISQLMLGIPMIILLEFSILLSTIVYKKKNEEIEKEKQEELVSE